MSRLLMSVALFCLLSVACVAQKTLPLVSPSVTIFHTQGTVQVLRQGATDWSPAAVQDELQPGDAIRTSEDSLAVLVLWDKSTMGMAPNTRLLVVDTSEAADGSVVRRFELSLGRVWSNVAKHPGTDSVYEIKGRHGLASVRGTQFEVASDGADTHAVRVFEGTVNYQQPGEDAGSAHDVHAGEGLVGQGKDLAVRPMPVAQRDEFENFNLETHQRMLPLMARMPSRIRPRMLEGPDLQRMRAVFQSRPFHPALQRLAPPWTRLRPLPLPPHPPPRPWPLRPVPRPRPTLAPHVFSRPPHVAPSPPVRPRPTPVAPHPPLRPRPTPVAPHPPVRPRPTPVKKAPVEK